MLSTVILKGKYMSILTNMLLDSDLQYNLVDFLTYTIQQNGLKNVGK